MKPHSSLAFKFYIASLTPLLVQIALLAVLFLMFLQMEKLAAYDERAQELVGRLNFLESRLASSVVATLAYENQPGEQNLKHFRIFRTQALGELSELYSLCLSDPRQEAAFARLNNISLKLLQKLTSKLSQNAAVSPTEKLAHEQLWTDFALARKQLLATERQRFERDVHFILGWKPDRRLVEFTLAIFIILDIAFAAFLVRRIGENIRSRIDTLKENSQRLTADQPLLPPVSGEDEIALLDAAFREMSMRLKQAKDTERLLLRSAADLICMVSEGGEFIKANPAALQVLGCAEEDIKSKRLSDFVPNERQSYLQEKLDSARNEKSDKTLDVTMQKQDGRTLETSWSIRYLPEESAFFCTIRDISEKAAIEQMKKDITRMVNHDIRSPLTTIQGVFDILEHPNLMGENAKAKQLLERARISCDMVLKLTKDLLDMDRLESGALQIDKTPASIDEIFLHAKESVSGISQKNGVMVEFDPTSLAAWVDADRLTQVITNLLTNSIKFSPRNSVVRLSASTNEGNLILSVADQGRGIPADVLPHIFDRFRQVSADDSTTHGGSGLGLSICKALVELHGGTITCTSALGNGTIFEIRIPQQESIEPAANESSSILL